MLFLAAVNTSCLLALIALCPLELHLDILPRDVLSTNFVVAVMSLDAAELLRAGIEVLDFVGIEDTEANIEDLGWRDIDLAATGRIQVFFLGGVDKQLSETRLAVRIAARTDKLGVVENGLETGNAFGAEGGEV